MRVCVHTALPVLGGWREIDTLSALFWIGRSVGRLVSSSFHPPTRSPQTHPPPQNSNQQGSRPP